jgi:predicted transcriptional regulator
MPLDPATLDTPRPRTTDGREYPEYLKAYEDFDDELIATLAEHERSTLDELALSISDARLRSVVSRWLSSAQWRGLVGRDSAGNGHRQPHWCLTERGRERLAELD